MPDPKEITHLAAGQELHTCPACGYSLGFHTSFVSEGARRDTSIPSSREGYRVILICPECGARYDVGWRISLSLPESRVMNSPVRSGACVPHGNPADCLPVPPYQDQHRVG